MGLLREKIMGRFPKCGAEELIAAVANYVDPYLKGFHLKELGLFEDTKQKMAEMWPSETDINENTDTENSRMAVCEIVNTPHTHYTYTTHILHTHHNTHTTHTLHT